MDRGSSNRTFDQIAEAIATFELSSEVNQFSSKYDYVMAGRAQFTPDEKAGYTLFRSSATHTATNVTGMEDRRRAAFLA